MTKRFSLEETFSYWRTALSSKPATIIGSLLKDRLNRTRYSIISSILYKRRWQFWYLRSFGSYRVCLCWREYNQLQDFTVKQEVLDGKRSLYRSKRVFVAMGGECLASLQELLLSFVQCLLLNSVVVPSNIHCNCALRCLGFILRLIWAFNYDAQQLIADCQRYGTVALSRRCVSQLRSFENVPGLTSCATCTDVWCNLVSALCKYESYFVMCDINGDIFSALINARTSPARPSASISRFCKIPCEDNGLSETQCCALPSQR